MSRIAACCDQCGSVWCVGAVTQWSCVSWQETDQYWCWLPALSLVTPSSHHRLCSIFTTTFSVVGLVQSYKTQEHEMFNCLKIDLN